MLVKGIERFAERLVPDGPIKEAFIRVYLEQFNPIYALKRLTKKTSILPDGSARLELTDGVVLYGPRDRYTTRVVKYGRASKLGELKRLEDYRDLLEVSCEQWVHNIYERDYALRPDDVVLDVGAHVGTFTVRAAREVGEGGLVIAVEPSADNIALCRRNVDANHLANVILQRQGVWTTKSTIELRQSITSGSHTFCHDTWDLGNTGMTEQVDVDTVDNIVAELNLTRLDFVKMDIEGAETLVLDGMSTTLARFGPRLAIAAYHRRGGEKTVIMWLVRHGYFARARGGIVYGRPVGPR